MAVAQTKSQQILENAEKAFQQSQFQKAVAYGQEGLLMTAASGDDVLFKQFLLILGTSYLESGDHANAIRQYLQLVMKSSEEGSLVTEQAEAYYLLGKVYLEMHAHGEAERCFTRSYDLYKAGKDKLGQAKSLQASALNSFEAKDYGSSSSSYQILVEEIGEYSGNAIIVDNIYEGLLKSLIAESRFSDAVTHGENYMILSKGSESKKPEVLDLLSSSYLETAQLDKALEISNSLNEANPSQPKFKLTLAKALTALGKIDQAKNVLNSAVAESRSKSDFFSLAESMNQQANLSLTNNDIESTIYYLKGAEQIAKENNFYPALINTYEYYIKAFAYSEEADKKVYYETKLSDLKKEIEKENREYRQRVANANLLVASIEERTVRNTSSSGQTQEEMVLISKVDSEIEGMDALDKIESEQALELSRKERMIMQQQWELQKAQTETAEQRKQIFILTTIFASVVIIVLAIFIWRGYQSRKIISLKNKGLAEHQVELQNAKTELTKALKLAEKNSADLQRSNIELKSAQTQLIQAEKMSSLGQLTAGIVHEIKNPVNFVRAGIETLDNTLENTRKILAAIQNLKDDPGSDKRVLDKLQHKLQDELSLAYEIVPNILKDVLFGTNRINEITNSLRIFSRQDSEELQSVSLHNIIDSALLILKTKYLTVAKIKLNYDSGVDDIECFPGQLNQVFVNLISNAVDAIPDKGVISITTKDLKDRVSIEIADTGTGMTEDVIEHIFEPFYTTKEPGSGTGLGLSISYSIIEKHGGAIQVNSGIGKGTRFTIILDKRMKQEKIKEARKEVLQEDILG